MTSTELQVAPSRSERLMLIGAQNIDLSLIYNAHYGPEDALLSVEEVLPDSAVFLEGCSTRADGLSDYERELLILNELRLSTSTEHEDYISYKTDIVDHIKNYVSSYIPADPNDFTVWKLTCIQALLEKDCLVYYADYRHPVPGAISTDEANAYKQLYLSNHEYIANTDLPDIAPGDSIGKAIKQLKNSIRGEVIAHAMRENRAANTVLYQTGNLVMTKDISTLRKSEEGKLSTYLLYGAAHERSLTWHFESRDIKPRVVQLHPLDEGAYIEVALSDNYNNQGRKVGHVALRSLTYDFMGLELAGRTIDESIISESYEYLDFLNGASKEDRLAFLVTCALVKRELKQNPRNALRQYCSILRSFMPSPKDFIVDNC